MSLSSVIADLFLPGGSARRTAAALPGLEAHRALLRPRARVNEGWRLLACAARRLQPARCACLQPAVAARARPMPMAKDAVSPGNARALRSPRLSSLHKFDAASCLAAASATLKDLAADFKNVFHGSGFALEPLLSGGFLITGPVVADARTMEPARCIRRSYRCSPAAPRPALRTSGHGNRSLAARACRAAGAQRARRIGGDVALWLWGGRTVLPTTAQMDGACRGHRAAKARYAHVTPILMGYGARAAARVEPAPLPERIEEVAAGVRAASGWFSWSMLPDGSCTSAPCPWRV